MRINGKVDINCSIRLIGQDFNVSDVILSNVTFQPTSILAPTLGVVQKWGQVSGSG